MTLTLDQFTNPSDFKTNGFPCDANDMCDLVIYICISPVTSPGYVKCEIVVALLSRRK